MIKIIAVISFFISFLAQAQQEEDFLANVRNSDLTMNNIRVYSIYNYLNPNLKTSLLIYDNSELKGMPKFIIDNEKLIDQRTSLGRTFNFKDYFSRNEKSQSIHVKEFPLQFIGPVYDGYYLVFDEVKNDVATFVFDNQKYFYSFKKSYFSESGWSSIRWKHVSTSDGAKKILRELQNTDRQFGDVIRAASQCIEEKNLECLIKTFPDWPIREEVDKWSIASDPQLCNQLRSGKMEHELVKLIKKHIVPWTHIKNGLIVYDEKTSIAHTLRNFGNEEVFEISRESGEGCYTLEEFLNVKFKLDRSKNKWSFEFESFIAMNGC